MARAPASRLGAGAAPIIEQAAQHPDPALRGAATAGLRSLDPEQAERDVDPLLANADPGVRKVATRSAAALDPPA